MKRRTKRRLLIGTCIIIVIAIIVWVITAIKNKNKITYNDGEDYKVEIKLPEYKDEKSGYKYVKNDGIETTNEMKSIFADFALVGENSNIEFEKKLYTFQNTMEYVKKYGNEEPNFVNFKKYVLDKDITGNLYTNVKETEINGVEGVQYTYDNSIIIVLNTDNIDTKSYIAIRIYTKDEDEDVNELMKDEKVQEILNTIKFSKN